MTEHDVQIVQDFKQRLPVDVSKHVRRIIVFGSRARGEAAGDSDLDMIALVDDKTPDIEAALESIAYNVMWDHDFLPIISLKVFAESSFKDAFERGFSFYRNVEAEGVSV